MARDGEIQNRGLLQAMADYLNIGGVKRAPPFLNTDQVQTVFALGSLPPRIYSLSKAYPAVASVGGDNIHSQDITGAAIYTIDPLFHNEDYDCELVGLNLQLLYDAAGALADNGKEIELYLSRYQNYGSADQSIVTWLRKWVTVATANQTYVFSLGSTYSQPGAASLEQQHHMASYAIPAGDRFSISIFRHATDGDWPANTAVNIQATILTNVPVGQAPYVPPGS